MKIKSLKISEEIKIKLIITFAIFVIMVLSFFFSSKIEKGLGLYVEYYPNQVSSKEIDCSKYKVSYIDVGQGNSSYIKLPDGKVLLIDAGNVPYGEKIVNILKNDGVKTIDYLIATHADSDHIGGFNNILDEFEVKNIYRPFQIAGSGTSEDTFVVYEDEDLSSVYKYMLDNYGDDLKISRVTSVIYKDFISKIYAETYTENGVSIDSNVTVFYDGLEIVGDGYNLEFFAPLVREDIIVLNDYSKTFGFATIGYGSNDSNGSSAIFLLTIGNEMFLFTGDAPFSSGSSKSSYEELDFINSLTEEEILKFSDISVYLVGHHGSKYSSSENLLLMTTPKFNIISADEDNTFSHPSNEVLERLLKIKECEDYIFTTKDFGTITFGVVDDKLCYCLEISTKKAETIISWEFLCIIIFVFITYFIFSIRMSKLK